MIFKKKVRVKKYEPRVEKDVTVVINTKTDTILKLDCVPSLSKDDVFKFNGNHNKKGLMNKKSEIILDAEWDNIKPLYDKTHIRNKRKRIVDFNQGIDSRLVNDEYHRLQ